MYSSNGILAHQRNANAGSTTLKRRFDNPYTPPQKRARSQTQTRGRVPLYDHNTSRNNMSRVSNYGGDVIPFASRNCAYPNPNPQFVPLPLPYRQLDDNPQSLNHSLVTNFPIRPTNFVPEVRFDGQAQYQAPPVVSQQQQPILSKDLFANNQSLNHSHVTSLPIIPTNFVPEVRFNGRAHYQAPPVVSQQQQPILSKDLFADNQSLNNSHVTSLPIIPTNFVPGVRFNGRAHYQAPPIVSQDLCAALLSLVKEKQTEPTLGLSFDSVKLGVRHESACKSVYADLPRQCTTCGTRFTCQEDHSKHMDWHVRKNRMVKEGNRTKANRSRVWYPSSSLFLSAGTMEAAKPCFGDTQKTREDEEQQQESVCVPADLDQPMCALCEERFVNFFSDEADDWLYKDAVYLNIKGLVRIVHAKCSN